MDGMSWWLWWRARRRLQEWVRTLIETRPYRIEFRTGQGSFVDFSARLIVVEPTMPDGFAPPARAIPTAWGAVHVARANQLQVLCARAAAWHEAAHVLFTTPGVTTPGLHHTLVNILEDERIERLVARYYPPSAVDLYELGRRLWLQGAVVAADRTTRLINATLYHRWDADRASGEPSRLDFRDPGERAVWEGRLRPLVEEAWIAPDTGAVSALALRILDILGVPPSSPLSNFRGLMAGPGGPPRGQRFPDDQALPATARGWSAPGGSDDPDDTEWVDSPIGRGHDPDVEGTLAGEAPDIDPSQGILWCQPYDALERAVAPEVRRLQEELRVRSRGVDPDANRHRGRFDAGALLRSRGERPLLRPAHEGDSPEELAVLLVIDGTSSTGGTPGGVTADNRPANPASFHDPAARMPHMRRAALLLQRACAGLGIPCAIAEACDDWYRVHDSRLPHRAPSPVTWLQTWDTDPNAEGPRALIAGLYGHAGKEEVCRALDLCAEAFRTRLESTKLLLYLHDGQPNDPVARIHATLARVRGSGVTVVGLYVGPQRDLERMQAIFGAEWTIGVEQLSALPARVGRILKRYRRER